jgi:hypothetical protein
MQINKSQGRRDPFFFPRKIINASNVEGDFRNDKEFLLSFANHDSSVLHSASDELRQDKQFVIECLKHYGNGLYHISNSDLKNDPDVIWIALFGPKEYEKVARSKGKPYYFGKMIGDMENWRYAGFEIQRNKDFLFAALMEFERRLFASSIYDIKKDKAYEQLKATYLLGIKDKRTPHVDYINNWWEYFVDSKLRKQFPHYRDFLTMMMKKCLEDNDE